MQASHLCSLAEHMPACLLLTCHPLCRCLYVRNLPFNITTDEMYDIFGKFGGIRQIRL